MVTVVTRIAITPAEWAETRKRAIDAGLRTSEYLALAVRRQNTVAKPHPNTHKEPHT